MRNIYHQLKKGVELKEFKVVDDIYYVLNIPRQQGLSERFEVDGKIRQKTLVR